MNKKEYKRLKEDEDLNEDVNNELLKYNFILNNNSNKTITFKHSFINGLQIDIYPNNRCMIYSTSKYAKSVKTTTFDNLNKLIDFLESNKDLWE